MSHAPAKQRRGVMRRNVEVFAALGDETRLSLLSALSAGEAMSITRLTEGRRVTRQSIAKHLGVLTRAGLVRHMRKGRETCYMLRPESLESARQSLDRISQQWDVALNRLKAMVEGEQS